MADEDARDVVRRQRVASLLLRGLAPLEIALQLKQQGVRDPQGQPYPVSVIAGDVAALEAEWQAQADDPARRARLLAELREARRSAWAKRDLNAVLRALQQEAALLDQHPSQPPRDFTQVSAADRKFLLPAKSQELKAES